MAANSRTTRLLAIVVLLAVGTVLLSAGMLRSVRVQNLPEEDPEKKTADYKAILVLSEPMVILDVTIGGLVMNHLGRLPRRGEAFTLGGLEFKVLRADRRRLELLRVVSTRDIMARE